MIFGSSGSQTSNTTVLTVIGLVACLVFFLVGAALIGLGIFLFIRAGKNQRMRAAEFEQMAQREIAQRQQIQNSWKNALERWNKMYYCGRDDCVFIPGEKTSAPLAKMKEYLKQ